MSEHEMNGEADGAMTESVEVNGGVEESKEESSKQREDARRDRLESLLNSKLFRDELVRVIEEEQINANGSSAVAMLREAAAATGNRNGVKPIQGAATGAVVPVFDLRGFEYSGRRFGQDEKLMRCALAALHRLVDLFGWNGDLCHRITARNEADNESFLVAPYGVLFSEVTASSLVSLAVSSLAVLEPGTTNFGPRCDANLLLHSTIYKMRPDIKCVVHVHTANVVAISAMRQGLLALSQEACLLGDVPTLEGINVDSKEVKEAFENNKNMVFLLRNQGALCCGRSVAEVFLYVYHLVLACGTQLNMVPLGLENLMSIDDATRLRVYEMGQRGGGGVNSKTESEIQWGVGELEFEALMRLLDNAGYRTGHSYKLPLVRGSNAQKLGKDTELPASLNFLLDEDNLYKEGPLRALLATYVKQMTKDAGRAKWMKEESKIDQ